MIARLMKFPLLLILWGIAALMMFLPALDGLMRDDTSVARAFGYSGLLGLTLVTVIGLAVSGRTTRDQSDVQNLLSLSLAYLVLPVYLALPFYEELKTTAYLNAYVEMVSALTTTGATLFAPARLVDSLHLWRGLVGWSGGLMIWVTASAVLAPLALGGFEVTARGEPGQGGQALDRFQRAVSGRRLALAFMQLAPVYLGLTGALWVLLVANGERSFVALIHAMSTMATSGISAVGGVRNAAAGVPGEILIFLFMLFALSRLTFSSDTITTARPGLHHDPEFRLGMALVLGVPLLLFLRHWAGALEVAEEDNIVRALQALWGAAFTVLSFLSTTGWESADWTAARAWSGLGTPGLILLGLSLVGGGVATTAGGVKLLRIFALMMHGRRELDRLVHPSSVGRVGAGGRRIRRQGAFIAWIFFMLYALSLALVTLLLAALGRNLEDAMIMAIAALSTTGPLLTVVPEIPIRLLETAPALKAVMAAAMVLGRLETLALIALFNPGPWRS